MGAWGYEPLESDTALDWIGDMRASKALQKDLEKGLHSKEYEHIRAASHMLVLVHKCHLLSDRVVGELIQVAIPSLKKILDDSKWSLDWDNPAAIQESIRSQIRELRSLDYQL